mmetsp:Transcript_48339/g.105182  ORF Transcript_48339/g.105182 Transcript_48339/m.105182 type:complete len:89 (+) Transcript_48339:74-340(+)
MDGLKPPSAEELAAKAAAMKPAETKASDLMGVCSKTVDALKGVWEKHGGNAEAICKECGFDLAKFQKHPPSGVEDFATKAVSGAWSIE